MKMSELLSLWKFSSNSKILLFFSTILSRKLLNYINVLAREELILWEQYIHNSVVFKLVYTQNWTLAHKYNSYMYKQQIVETTHSLLAKRTILQKQDKMYIYYICMFVFTYTDMHESVPRIATGSLSLYCTLNLY